MKSRIAAFSLLAAVIFITAISPTSQAFFIEGDTTLFADHLSSTLWSKPNDCVTDGDFAYLIFSRGLIAIDYSDRLNPTGLSRRGPEFGGLQAAYSDGQLIVVDGSGLRVIDVSDPTDPVFLGDIEYGISTYNQHFDLSVQGDFAYVATGRHPNRLLVIDISNPSNPVIASDYSVTDADIEQVFADGDYAYLYLDYCCAGSIDTLHIVDISNPTGPLTHVGSYTSGEINYTIDDVVSTDGYVYLGHRYEDLTVIDATDPANPFLIASYDNDPIPPYGKTLHLDGDILYMTCGYGLSVFDISDPANPDSIANLSLSINDIDVMGDIGCANVSDGIQIIDLSDPTDPVPQGTFHVSATAMDVCVVGDYAYVAAGSDGIRILDVSDPFSPELVGGFKPDSSISATRLDIADGYAYVLGDEYADDRGYILDISEPTNPFEVGILPDAGTDIDVEGNYACITHDNLLSVFDISDPYNPSLSGMAHSPDISFCKVCIDGDYIYVADVGYEWGFYIYSLSDLVVFPGMTPVGHWQMLWGLAKQMSGWSILTDIYVSDNHAYVTTHSGYRNYSYFALHIVDVSDVTSPTTVGMGWDTGEPVYNRQESGSGRMYVNDGYAFVDGAPGGGISVIDISVPTDMRHVGSVRPDKAYGSGMSIFFADGLTYYPFYDAVDILEIAVAPCCGYWTEGYTGNTNCDEDGLMTLSDITRLIDFVFISKNPLCCEGNGNTNGSEDEKITLSDITRLIDNVYISKEPTELCR